MAMIPLTAYDCVRLQIAKYESLYGKPMPEEDVMALKKKAEADWVDLKTSPPTTYYGYPVAIGPPMTTITEAETYPAPPSTSGYMGLSESASSFYLAPALAEIRTLQSYCNNICDQQAITSERQMALMDKVDTLNSLIYDLLTTLRELKR